MTTVRTKTQILATLAQAADWLALGVAVSLPWSTTATSILIALWLAVALPTFDIATVRRELATAAGGLPVLLWALGAVGMLWADAPWHDRLGGLGGFNKLLVIPLLLAHFRRSERGVYVLQGFLVSVVVLLLLAWALVLFPNLPWRGGERGIPVRDYIIQSTEFLICAFVLLDFAFGRARASRWSSVAGMVALVSLFFANIVFVAIGRTALLVIPVLALLLGWRQSGSKGLFCACLVGLIVGGTAWFASPYLRGRLNVSLTDFGSYLANDAPNSTGLHLEFLRKAVSFVETAPVFGHGTGSIPTQFRNASINQTGASAVATDNPHNQILAVAIQIGLVGAGVLLAMWIAHLLLFRGAGLTAWIGMVIVVQNIISSFVNSHLFDFLDGWLYVFGVGVVGGMMLREKAL
jgi:O-antigen ligase